LTVGGDTSALASAAGQLLLFGTTVAVPGFGTAAEIGGATSSVDVSSFGATAIGEKPTA
jgi:hypothetical protein